MTGCRDAELLLQDYIDGYLLPSQRELLESHLGRCDSCGALLEEMRRLEANFSGLGEVEAPDALRDRILESLPPVSIRQRLRLPHTFGSIMAAAIVIVLGFVGGTWFGMKAVDGTHAVEIAFFAPAAETVTVVGDFNDWQPDRNPMARGKDGMWRARLRLPPGIYEYGLIIDGTDYSRDPRAERFLADGFGGENSVLFIEG